MWHPDLLSHPGPQDRFGRHIVIPLGLLGLIRSLGCVEPEGHAARIRDYLDNKPKGKFGKHAHSPEDWGFTREGIRADTQAYVEAFGVELEG